MNRYTFLSDPFGSLGLYLFCIGKYFLEYNGELVATAHLTKFRRSSLPQGDLEIPIKLRVRKGKASLEIFRKIKDFVLDKLPRTRKSPVRCKDGRRRGRLILSNSLDF